MQPDTKPKPSAAEWPQARAFYSVALIGLSIIVACIPLPWSRWGGFGLAGLFLVTFGCGMMAFLPSPAYGVIYSAARGIGPLAATCVGGLGWSMGEMVLFHAGRGIPKGIAGWAERFLPILTKNLRGGWRRFALIFLITLIPNPLFDVVSLLAARLGLRARTYFIPMAAARVVRSALIALIAVHQGKGP
jgi:membrane protein YqaA with SNARE-associated domain